MMQFCSFYQLIKASLEKNLKREHLSKRLLQEFSSYLERIFTNSEEETFFKMTSMTILFEGFYRFLPDDSNLKKEFLGIRLKRWTNHFGTPTLPFLLSFKNQIDQTCYQFKQMNELPPSTTNSEESLALKTPWQFKQTPTLEEDRDNCVVVDTKAVSNILMPEPEKTGIFIKTNNPFGGFTTTPCDTYSQKFIEYAGTIAKKEGRVLEIGAAFGAASLQALSQGATVFCNDVDPQNLAVVRNRYLQEAKDSLNSITGDDKKLVLIPGSFPNELTGLPQGFFDAILICRVLHFFTGSVIDQSLKLMASILKPGGKLFVVCETPFLKNWQRFIPEFVKRVAAGAEWPGEITNPAEFESSGRSTALPSFVHWITKDVIDRSLIRTNLLTLEQSSYVDRRGQFPDDLVLDGRESVGAIAVRTN